MDELQPLISRATSCLSKGFVEDAYFAYFDALEVAIKNLRSAVFCNNSITRKPLASGLIFDTCFKCLHEAQDIIETNSTCKPIIPPKPTLAFSIPRESEEIDHQPSGLNRSTSFPRRKPLPSKPLKSLIVSPVKPSSLHIDIPGVSNTHLMDTSGDDSDADRSPESPSLSISPPDSPNLKMFEISPLPIPTNMILPPRTYLNICPEGCVDPNVLVPPLLDEESEISDNIPHIPKSPLVTSFATLSEKLQTANDMMIVMGTSNKGVEEYSDNNTEAAQNLCSSISSTQATLGKVNNLIHLASSTVSITSFSSYLVAYQLTLIESALFQRIPPEALLTHSPRTPHPSIVASTDFFNYLTRIIEISILSSSEASHRAQALNYWVKIATRLYELNNFQTLKAVLSATGTPPIQRLKRTWACIPKKTIVRLEALTDLMSEKDNYERYRETMINGSAIKKQDLEDRQIVPVTKPTIPFLGVFIMDITYLLAAVKKTSSTSSPMSPKHVHASSYPGILNTDRKLSPTEDPRVQELLTILRCYLAGPKYSSTPHPGYLKSKSRLFTFGTSSECPSSNSWEKMHLLRRRKEFSDEDLYTAQQVITHYILTRTWIPERQVDELSAQREYKKPVSEKASDRLSSTTSQNSVFSSSSSNPSSIEEDVYMDKHNSTGGIRDTLGNIKQHLHLSLGSRYNETDINYNSKRSSFSFRPKNRHSVGASAPEVLFSPVSVTLTSLDEVTNLSKPIQSPNQTHSIAPNSPKNLRSSASPRQSLVGNVGSTRGSEAAPFSYVSRECLVEALNRRSQRIEEGNDLTKIKIQSLKIDHSEQHILGGVPNQGSPQLTRKMNPFSKARS
ncbi:hypothetical protein K7432_010685 [Basidiobolus ranarum]|uniref:Ras-GEF domain-containing protein n=1 Tax=Basidiobolus ranarum TaxID=34480 RepID=A0ABR2WNF5_9FUNG